MKSEIKQTVMEKMSRTAVKMAMKTAQMPNQCCPFFLGKPHSEMALSSKEFREMASILKD